MYIRKRSQTRCLFLWIFFFFFFFSLSFSFSLSVSLYSRLKRSDNSIPYQSRFASTLWNAVCKIGFLSRIFSSSSPLLLTKLIDSMNKQKKPVSNFRIVDIAHLWNMWKFAVFKATYSLHFQQNHIYNRTICICLLGFFISFCSLDNRWNSQRCSILWRQFNRKFHQLCSEGVYLNFIFVTFAIGKRYRWLISALFASKISSKKKE